jgi:peptide/nickel transport system permease protein
MIAAARSLRPATTAGATLLAFVLALGAVGPWLTAADPFSIAGPALATPNTTHPFGTDDLGRDVLAGVIHGAATSLLVGFVSAGCAALIGLLVGGWAAMRPGALDHLLMRFTDLAQAVPRFFLAVVVVSLFGGNVWLIVAVIGSTAWPSIARVFRAQVLSVVTRDFVLAARASGGTELDILRRHVLPMTAAVVAAQVSYQVGIAILAEAGLSFLGLGDPTRMSWGTLLGAAHQTVAEAWWVPLFPGLALTVTVFACNLLGDALTHTGR